MTLNLWTDAELAMLYTNLTNEEIAKEIGRTKKAVRKKRYLITGHYVENEKQRDPMPPHISVFDERYKEARILSLAKRMGVKLYG